MQNHVSLHVFCSSLIFLILEVEFYVNIARKSVSVGRQYAPLFSFITQHCSQLTFPATLLYSLCMNPWPFKMHGKNSPSGVERVLSAIPALRWVVFPAMDRPGSTFHTWNQSPFSVLVSCYCKSPICRANSGTWDCLMVYMSIQLFTSLFPLLFA